MIGLSALLNSSACSGDNNDIEPENVSEVCEDNGDVESRKYFGGKRALVVYFSWGGTTQRMAQTIEEIIVTDIFRIEPVTPFPSGYTPCTEVARKEKDDNARPDIAKTISKWEEYDVVFIGCPVWWWTTPIFCESYDFAGKTVVPFCTYAATYRDETLAEIVRITPAAKHLTGEGLTSGRIRHENVEAWIGRIDVEWRGFEQRLSVSDF